MTIALVPATTAAAAALRLVVFAATTAARAATRAITAVSRTTASVAAAIALASGAQAGGGCTADRGTSGRSRVLGGLRGDLVLIGKTEFLECWN